MCVCVCVCVCVLIKQRNLSHILKSDIQITTLFAQERFRH